MSVGGVGGVQGVDLDALDGHTPGPWSILPAKDTGGGPLVGWSLQSERRYLCIIRHEDGQATAADAALIAAAPDLLAECRRLRADLAAREATVAAEYYEATTKCNNAQAALARLREAAGELCANGKHDSRCARELKVGFCDCWQHTLRAALDEGGTE